MALVVNNAIDIKGTIDQVFNPPALYPNLNYVESRLDVNSLYVEFYYDNQVRTATSSPVFYILPSVSDEQLYEIVANARRLRIPVVFDRTNLVFHKLIVAFSPSREEFEKLKEFEQLNEGLKVYVVGPDDNGHYGAALEPIMREIRDKLE